MLSNYSHTHTAILLDQTKITSPHPTFRFGSSFQTDYFGLLKTQLIWSTIEPYENLF